MLRVEELTVAILEVLPRTTWFHDLAMEAAPMAKQHRSNALIGDGDGWHFVVLDFELSGGRRGVDGTATKGTIVFRLTPELAEKVFMHAMKSLTRSQR
jgi:hypothetical protein